jgi:stearoyl-CoA desaturase (Delta-9 desaturase)
MYRLNDVTLAYANRALGEQIYAWWSVLGTFVCASLAITDTVRARHFSLALLTLCVGFLLLTGFGVSAGLHRYFTHRSFKATRAFSVALAVLGIASAQGYFLRWIYDHRIHHRLTDAPGDPHSPYFFGPKQLHGCSGLLHAHFLWLFRHRESVKSEVIADHAGDGVMVALDRYSPLIVLAGVLLPGAFALLIDCSAAMFLKGALWGGPVRMFLLNHIVWGVNSIGHRFGGRALGASGEARNNALLGLLAFGDGWHANHHLSPTSARHGRVWYQIDISWIVLVLLARLGLVSALRDPTRPSKPARMTWGPN